MQKKYIFEYTDVVHRHTNTLTIPFKHTVEPHGMRPHLIKAALRAQIPVVAGAFPPRMPPLLPLSESREQRAERDEVILRENRGV